MHSKSLTTRYVMTVVIVPCLNREIPRDGPMSNEMPSPQVAMNSETTVRWSCINLLEIPRDGPMSNEIPSPQVAMNSETVVRWVA